MSVDRATLPAARARRLLDEATEGVLAQLEARECREKAIAASLAPGEMPARRDEFLLSIGPAAGLLLHLLAEGAGARHILELGTSYGYSTVWLAHAARATGGHVTSVDVSAEKQGQACMALRRAGLVDYVRFLTGDAIELLRGSATGAAFDFVLLDLWKDSYIACVDALLGRLHPGATIVADNMIEPPIARTTAAEYLAHLDRVPTFRTVVAPVGNGLAISRYVPAPELATCWPSA